MNETFLKERKLFQNDEMTYLKVNKRKRNNFLKRQIDPIKKMKSFIERQAVICIKNKIIYVYELRC